MSKTRKIKPYNRNSDHGIFQIFRRPRRFLGRHRIFRVVLAIVVLWLLGSLGMLLAESDNQAFRSLPHSAWNLMVYLTSGFEGEQPVTTLGKVIGVTVVILGIALVGLFTATIASVFVEKAIREGRGMHKVKMKGHIVICGWNEKASEIVYELHSPAVIRRRQAIVIIKREGENHPVDKSDQAFDDVYFVIGEPHDEHTLRRAAVADAYSAIVLADRSNLNRADAESILVALAIESINPDVHTIVEVMDSVNLKHFKHLSVDECISQDQLGNLLLSQVALNHGISSFFQELLTFQPGGNQVFHVPIPEAFVGKTFGDLARTVMSGNMVAVGLKKDGHVAANPRHDIILAAEDRILVIAHEHPDLGKYKPF